MITTTSMRQMIALVLDRDVENVTQALLEAGTIHFINIQEISADWAGRLKPASGMSGSEKARDLRRRLEAYLDSAGISPELLSSDIPMDLKPADLNDAERQLDNLGTEIRRTRQGQKEIQDRIIQLEGLGRQLPSVKGPGRIQSGNRGYVTTRTGKIAESTRKAFKEAIKDLPAVYIANDETADSSDILITLKKDDDRIKSLLEKFEWIDFSDREIAVQGKSTVNQEMKISTVTLEKIEELKVRQELYSSDLTKSLSARSEALCNLWMGLRSAELGYLIKSHYRKTEQTYLFSGWIPYDKQMIIESILTKVSANRCYIEWHIPGPPDSEMPVDVPVQIRNPGLLKPFQMLVENYGIPAYGSIDPTPIVALFYLLMFGLMFGDVGHGLIVLLIGFTGNYLMRKRKKKSNLFPLIVWCGLSAMVFGALFGSYFGMSLLPPLWFDYHAVVNGHHGEGSVKSIMDILVLTIYFGIFVLSTGLVLNWINRLRSRDWIGLIWENGGLLVGWIYAGGTTAAFYFTAHEYKHLPDSGQLLLTLGLPILLMFFKPIAERKKSAEVSGGVHSGKINIMTMVMEWLVELLEIFSGYLSNTLSFLRVAGLGIAHVSLMTAFFQIAHMASSNGTLTLWSYLILIAGNVLVIGLEGLSAGIQSLRLNYYEFFSKYFNGSGKIYAPVSLLRPN